MNTDTFARLRQSMIAEIAEHAIYLSARIGKAALSRRVLEVMDAIPRHAFVPVELQAFAYANTPLPIGFDKTISQPFIVALMTQLIDPRPTDQVLEIGTGSGYQAAVLAKLVARVYTIEIVRPLGERAAELLRELGLANVDVRIGDGYLGWPEAAPFDAIVVTAAPDRMPQPLIDQLAPGGRLIAPIGPQGGTQNLLLMRKDSDGRTLTRNVLPVRFVPLTRH
jgi:protein-L-isoaspartate(D-aspartate) O-methyltransferase